MKFDLYLELTYDQLKEVLANWLKPENKNKKSENEDAELPPEDEAPQVPKKKSEPVQAVSNPSDVLSEFDKLFDSK